MLAAAHVNAKGSKVCAGLPRLYGQRKADVHFHGGTLVPTLHTHQPAFSPKYIKRINSVQIQLLGIIESLWLIGCHSWLPWDFFFFALFYAYEYFITFWFVSALSLIFLVFGLILWSQRFPYVSFPFICFLLVTDSQHVTNISPYYASLDFL